VKASETPANDRAPENGAEKPSQKRPRKFLAGSEMAATLAAAQAKMAKPGRPAPAGPLAPAGHPAPAGAAARPKSIPKSGVSVRDSLGSSPGSGESSGDPPAGILTPEAAKGYRFEGDCIIENEYLALRVPRGERPIEIEGRGQDPVRVPVTISGRDSRAPGSRTIVVTDLSGDSAAIEIGPGASAGPGPKFACRVDGGKHYVRFEPRAGTERLSVAVKSQIVVVPSEFGEDQICDSALCRPGQSIPVPTERLVVALDCSSSAMTVLTYPSFQQSGTVSITAGSPGSQAPDVPCHASALGARFADKPLVVGVLPQKNNWFFEPVNKKYSASGQYDIRWEPPYPGVWRLIGRVKGRYFATDVPHNRFVFACSQSGTLDFLVAYLNAPAPGERSLATPETIYREAFPPSGEALAAGDAAAATTFMTRKTRYRDVCNSVDDMRDVWRTRREVLGKDPDYIKNLLEDCRAILERMDRRLAEYRGLVEHLDKDLAELQAKEQGEAGAELKSFAAAVQKHYSKLKSIKIVDVSRGVGMIGKILERIDPQAGRTSVAELDRMAENMREVANHQEEQLKKLRAAALPLADACAKNRKSPEAVQPYVQSIGRHCRAVLRNRDPEE
jgi:hypothetical protein